jgi:hypothetical protein
MVTQHTRSFTLTPESSRAILRTLDPNRAVRLGVLANPRARQGRYSGDHVRMWRMLDEPGDLITTRSPAEVSAALEHLIVNRGVNALAIVGGDGTIHSVLNALWPLLDALEEAIGRRVPPPPFLLLHGGTMNLASRAMNTKGNPLPAIERFLSHAAGRSLDAVLVKEVGVMQVHAGSHRLHGMIFGSELVHNAVEMHRLLGDGYRGLLSLVAHVVVGSRIGTETWKRHAHLLRAPQTPAFLDDVTYARYSGAVASTVDLKLARGWVQSLRIDETAAEGFHVKILLETEQRRMIGLVNKLFLNSEDARIVDVDGASSLRVKGPFTLDGELYPVSPETDVSLTLHPRRLRAFQQRSG